MKASEIVHCVDCNEEFPRKELNRNGRCPGCAYAAVRDSMNQLHNKSGPYYEKWRKAMQAVAQRL